MSARILLVEDENIVAMEIADLLQALGHSVCGVVASGEDAITGAADANPDLILMDIRLKGEVDGIQAAQHVHTHLDIPVVYLTAYADDGTVQRAKVTEPFGYLVKPFDEQQLHTAIEMALYKHQMESKLKERERWLATILKGIGEGVIATDEQGCITFMNPLAATLLGWEQEESLGKEPSELVRMADEETRAPIEDPVQQVLREGKAVGSNKAAILITSNGPEKVIDYNASPIQDDQGNTLGVVLVLRDATERRQMEMALLHSERLAAMGHLAAALAHEINNPLHAITGSIDLVADYPLDAQKQAETLQHARQELGRLTTVTNEMLDFSRPPVVERRPVDLGDAVRYALSLAGKQLEHSAIKFDLSLPDDLPPVLASHDQLVQVLLNLLINAVEAMPDGGRLDIEARLVGEKAEVVLTDDGPGLPPDNLDKVFLPFHSTKQGGTGLGLSISHSIIQQHGGTISAGNTPGGGAVFTIALPLAPTEGA
jgi:PAS domain S-box-containing protein